MSRSRLPALGPHARPRPGAGGSLTGHRAVQVSLALLEWRTSSWRWTARFSANCAAEPAPSRPDPTGQLVLYLGNRDVPHPYGGDENSFTVGADLIDAAVQQHLP